MNANTIIPIESRICYSVFSLEYVYIRRVYLFSKNIYIWINVLTLLEGSLINLVRLITYLYFI